jgi:CRP-like cAMP-binding protein
MLSAGGKELVLSHLYEGHSFGETSIVNGGTRNANVRALQVPAIVFGALTVCLHYAKSAQGEVHCMVMSKDSFKPFLDQDPKFRKM